MRLTRSLCLVPIAILLAVCALTATAATSTSVPVNLSWTIPATRIDGAPLAVSELAGYEIYYAVDSNAPVAVTVKGGSTTATTVTLLLGQRATPYTTNWSIAAVDTSGLKSPLSSVVTLTINVPLAAPGAPTAITIKLDCTNGKCTVVQ